MKTIIPAIVASFLFALAIYAPIKIAIYITMNVGFLEAIAFALFVGFSVYTVSNRDELLSKYKK